MKSKFSNIFNNYNEIQNSIDLLKENKVKNYKDLVNKNKKSGLLIRAASKCARDIYYSDFTKDFNDNEFRVIDISDCCTNVVAIIIYNSTKNDDTALIIIRGTVGFDNWRLNFNVGCDLFKRVIFSLILFLFPILVCFLAFCFVESLFICNDYLSGFNLTFIKYTSTAFLNITSFYVVPLFIGSFLSLRKNALNKKEFVHCGYDLCAKKIVNKVDELNLDLKRIVIIGHSLSGGVSERVYAKMGEKNYLADIKGIVFNSASGQLNENESFLYIYYGMDLLTVFNQVFVRQIKNKLWIENKMLSKINRCLKYFLIFSILLLIVFNDLNVGEVPKSIYWFYYIVTIIIFPFIINFIKSSFINNHLMNNLINEIED